MHSEIKARGEVDAQLLQNKYKYAMALIGLALLNNSAKTKDEKNDKDVTKEVCETSSKLSQIILPTISYLGELEAED